MFYKEINRGYYMAVRRYEISIRLLLYYTNTNVIPSHFTSKLFCCKMFDSLCSHSNNDLFTRENNMLYVFVQKLTWYFTGVNMIIQVIAYQIGLSNIR